MMHVPLKSLAAVLLLLAMAGCSPENSASNHIESVKSATPSNVPRAQLKTAQRYYVSTGSLNVRSTNSTSEANVLGKLVMNDQVEVFDLLDASSSLVQVKIVQSVNFVPAEGQTYFISKDYMSLTPVTVLAADGKVLTPNAASKYFIIQNVATEKTRVYERCTETPDCPHRLVFETDTVVGRPEEGTKTDPKAYITWLGHSRIADWVKFYSDGAGTYPSWYTAGQDISTIPGPITSGATKLTGSRKWTVKDKKGNTTMYGAFGWYAARLSPADASGVNYQWMHGTIGWGQDGEAAIEVTRGFFVNLFSNPGSHGCTRLENRAIAFMRSFLVPGTDVYRVYARESVRETAVPLSRYTNEYRTPGQWEYILLTDGAQKTNGLTADANEIRGSGISILKGVNFLEEGVYNYDRYPHAVGLDYNSLASSGKTGDRYQINSGRQNETSNFRGYYLVDEGRFVDYQHPDEKAVRGKVKVSGLAGFRTTVPETLKTTGEHNPPPVKYKRNDDNSSGGA